jgi:hypothetical protein
MTVDVILNRMMEASPEQYETSRIYQEIQRTIATELATIDTNNKDLKKQLHVRTATWGLKYWESAIGSPVLEFETNEVRRSRVLARLRSIGNFSIAMVRSIAEAFTDAPLDVSIDFETGVIRLEYTENFPNINDFRSKLDDVIHAHLAYEYVSRIHNVTTLVADQKIYAITVDLDIITPFFGYYGGYNRPLTLDGRVILDGDSQLNPNQRRRGPRNTGQIKVYRNNVLIEGGTI